MTLVEFLRVFGSPLALTFGAVTALWLTRGGHYRQCCPSTATTPDPTRVCVCRCRSCRDGHHPTR